MNQRNSSMLILVVMFFGIICATLNAQVNLKKVGNYQYAQYNGVWYTVIDGRQGNRMDPKHLVVRLKDKSNIDLFDFQGVSIPKLKNVRGEFADGFYELEIPAGHDGFEIAEKLEKTGKFDEVLFNFFVDVDANPNDQYYNNQWALSQINVSSAWNITTGVNSVILAVIDEGGDYNHEDLIGNKWSGTGYDFHNNDSDPYPDDEARHGTAVAGILGAVTNNGIGVSGVAGGWGGTGGVRIMHLDAGYRWYDQVNQEWRESLSPSAIAQAIDYAAVWGAKVINMSFSSPSGFTAWSSAINSAVNNYGVVCVASAGNYRSGDPTNIGYPAAYSNVIAVGATTPSDTRKELNDGTEWWWGSCYGSQLDIMAPGVYIYTTDITGSIGYSTGNYYNSFNGTSSAAPHVAGLAALIRSISPSFNAQQVRDILLNSAEKVSGMGGQNFHNEYGYGRINAYEALKYTFANYNLTLSGNYTFSENINIGQTLTIASGANITFSGSASLIINSGANLVVSPNANIEFGTGSLTVNGTITADGSSNAINFGSTGGSKWGGIKLQSTASANSVIKYCNIDNANQGIYIGLSNSGSSNFPTVEYNTITNCNDGIYLYNSEGSSGKPLRYNDVSGSTNGIRFEGLAGYSNYVWITNNSLYNNESGLVIRYAHPRLFYNHSTCNGYGVKVENYSYPKFAGTSTSSSGYNRFADNSGANLYANNNVNVWMGQLNEVDEGQYGGNNTLGSYDDSQNPWFPYYIKAYNASTVMANYSYFGAFPPVSWKIDKDGSSSIDYTNYLNFDPSPGSACSESIVQNFRRDNDEPSLISSSAEGLETKGKRLGGFATKGVSQSAPSLLLYLGMHHYMMDNPDSANYIWQNYKLIS